MQKIMYLLLMLMSSLLSADSYDSEKAVKNGDVINMHGPIYNFARFEEFLDVVKEGNIADVRITNYAIDGNPTLYNLTFDGTVFHLEIDQSKNKNRGDSPNNVRLSCNELVREVGQQLYIYTLKECQNSTTDSFNLLNILKEQEDNHEH
ncbi:DUF4362 domain-containing protein [Sporosarcina highlanderae]|uniref:DUF4362 domain-containing protein n=1 Tax=Sporosarcina highlanderae TaxID=3035916 RepID=A0ABT8JWG9_9BACL|nr:DUF4362 domain-containing protein [Sporosarcina highlanderae]MDN4608489.1 DUF4362 domain-containing protein [Sporosarcina highlanderae]